MASRRSEYSDNAESIDADDQDTTDLFASPSIKRHHAKADVNYNNSSPLPSPSRHSNVDHIDLEASHEERLRSELASLKSINAVITGITASLAKAKDNAETVSTTVSNASSLLSMWTRIVGQTEHNQRLILNPAWTGASQDLADAEAESMENLRQVNIHADNEDNRGHGTEDVESETRSPPPSATATNLGKPPASRTSHARSTSRGGRAGSSVSSSTRATNVHSRSSRSRGANRASTRATSSSSFSSTRGAGNGSGSTSTAQRGLVTARAGTGLSGATRGRAAMSAGTRSIRGRGTG